MRPTPEKIVKAVLRQHGRTLSQALGFKLSNAPSPLFRILCASMLSSARLRADIAVAGAKALFDQGWVTPEKMAAAATQQRLDALKAAGYTRYVERTAAKLGEMAQTLVEEYQGDLRQLREKAEHRPDQERYLLEQFKGVGEVGVDIFFREIQEVWEELRPFADQRALKGARNLGLNGDPRSLAQLAGERDFTKLLSGLIWVQVSKDYQSVLQAARG